MTDTATPPPEESAPDPSETMLSREFLGLLVLSALIGAVASVVAWGFLQLIAHLETWVYSDLPNGLGFDSTPLWWSVPVLAIAGVIVAFAIARLPGNGGHVPADGLKRCAHGAQHAPGRRARGRGLHRSRGSRRPRGPADRDRRRPGDPERPPPQTRRASRGDRGRRGRGDVCGGGVPLRVSADRRADPDRGSGPGWLEAEDRPGSGPPGVRRRLAGLDRDGLLDRAQHYRDLDLGPEAAAVRTARASPTSAGRSFWRSPWRW